MNLSKSLAELGFSVIGPYSTLAQAVAAAGEREVDAALLDADPSVNLSSGCGHSCFQERSVCIHHRIWTTGLNQQIRKCAGVAEARRPIGVAKSLCAKASQLRQIGLNQWFPPPARRRLEGRCHGRRREPPSEARCEPQCARVSSGRGVPGQHDFEVACFLMEEVPLQGIIGVTLAPKPRDPHRAECSRASGRAYPILVAAGLSNPQRGRRSRSSLIQPSKRALSLAAVQAIDRNCGKLTLHLSS